MVPFKSSTRKKRIKCASVANSILLSTAKVAAKGTESTFKYLAKDHTGTAEYCHIHGSLMEMRQRINYTRASLDLFSRKSARTNERIGRLLNTGIDDSLLERASGWLVDHTIYAWDLLWGFITPIVGFILWGIFRVVIIILFNIIFFYVLFKLITL